ncbi:hypothetical protein CDD83_9915 [Cordyceps sp. RAO-2017]|nr:hypothetical protein CDD83_9915 [Cordyceps sp. RAO-2017]
MCGLASSSWAQVREEGTQRRRLMTSRRRLSPPPPGRPESSAGLLTQGHSFGTCSRAPSPLWRAVARSLALARALARSLPVALSLSTSLPLLNVPASADKWLVPAKTAREKGQTTGGGGSSPPLSVIHGRIWDRGRGGGRQQKGLKRTWPTPWSYQAIRWSVFRGKERRKALLRSDSGRIRRATRRESTVEARSGVLEAGAGRTGLSLRLVWAHNQLPAGQPGLHG